MSVIGDMIFLLYRRVLAFALLAAVSGLSGQSAVAQSNDHVPPSPATNYLVSDGGVDMRTGQFVYSNTDLSIGVIGGIDLVRDNGTNDFHVWTPMGQFSHNWHIYATYKPIKNGGANFTVQGSRGGQFVSGSNTNNFVAGSTTMRGELRAVPIGTGALDRYLVYTAPDGARIRFRHARAYPDDPNPGAILAGAGYYAESVTEANGVTYSLSYDEPTSSSPAYLRRVTSNAGYVLVFEYQTNSSGKFISKACLYNAAIETVPTSNTCSAASYKVSYGYGSNGYMTSYRDPANAVWTYASTFNPSNWPTNPWYLTYTWTDTYFRPGETSPYLTNTVSREPFVEYVAAQTFAGGPSYTYSWTIVEHTEMQMEVAGGTASRNDGTSVRVGYQRMRRVSHVTGEDSYLISEGPNLIVDELGRTLAANYCVTQVVAPQMPVSGGATGCAAVSARYWEFEEGNRNDYTYNGRGSVVALTRIGKPGSGESDIVRSFTYDCSSLVNCMKPVTVTDERGNVTDYEYDNVHGGILAVTSPADANNIRPQTRYTYGQRYAWFKSGSAYARAATPIWVLLTEEYCRTSFADANGNCTGGATDEVVTSYQYEAGNSTTPSNLNLLGVSVRADSGNGSMQTLRTCYQYDDRGRQIAETQPAANLSSCS